MAVKNRNPLFVVVVSIVTFFIYALYWFYETRKELNELTGETTSPLIWLIGFFIPLVNIYVLWKYCKAVEEVSNKARSAILLLILWIVLMPVAQYLIQIELNKKA